jgi:hypothetical protein
MTDESAVMLRIGIFGLVVAVVYWLVTYEWLGSVALLTLGLGPGFAGLVMAAMQPEVREGGVEDVVRRLVGLHRERPADETTGEAAMVIPAPTIWPFVLSVGFAIALTGLIFGLWLVLIGAIFAVAGLWGWGSSVFREYIANRALTEVPAARPAVSAEPAGAAARHTDPERNPDRG